MFAIKKYSYHTSHSINTTFTYYFITRFGIITKVRK